MREQTETTTHPKTYANQRSRMNGRYTCSHTIPASEHSESPNMSTPSRTTPKMLTSHTSQMKPATSPRQKRTTESPTFKLPHGREQRHGTELQDLTLTRACIPSRFVSHRHWSSSNLNLISTTLCCIEFRMVTIGEWLQIRLIKDEVLGHGPYTRRAHPGDATTELRPIFTHMRASPSRTKP